MFYTAREILLVVGAAIGILSTAIPLIIKLVRKTKQFIKERDWNSVMNILPKLVAEAEKFINYTGQEKKEFVKSRLAVFAVKNKIVFDEARFEAAIDDIVKLTKDVNKRDKDTALHTQINHSNYNPYNQY